MIQIIIAIIVVAMFATAIAHHFGYRKGYADGLDIDEWDSDGWIDYSKCTPFLCSCGKQAKVVLMIDDNPPLHVCLDCVGKHRIAKVEQ